MAEIHDRLEAEDLQQSLREVQELVQGRRLVELRSSLDRMLARFNKSPSHARLPCPPRVIVDRPWRALSPRWRR